MISLLDPRLSDKLEKALFDPAGAAPRPRDPRIGYGASEPPRREPRIRCMFTVMGTSK